MALWVGGTAKAARKAAVKASRRDGLRARMRACRAVIAGAFSGASASADAGAGAGAVALLGALLDRSALSARGARADPHRAASAPDPRHQGVGGDRSAVDPQAAAAALAAGGVAARGAAAGSAGCPGLRWCGGRRLRRAIAGRWLRSPKRWCRNARGRGVPVPLLPHRLRTRAG